MEMIIPVPMLMYGKVSQENYVELTAASACLLYTSDVYKRQEVERRVYEISALQAVCPTLTGVQQ